MSRARSGKPTSENSSISSPPNGESCESRPLVPQADKSRPARILARLAVPLNRDFAVKWRLKYSFDMPFPRADPTIEEIA